MAREPSLADERWGSGPPMLLVHGFTQTARCWAPVADHLAAAHRVVAVDAPGHGRSAVIRADLWQTAALLAEIASDLAEPATVIGYSMGGRMALHLALAHPVVVGRLVLVSATAGIEDAAARAARRQADDELADRIGSIGVDAFLDEWLALPLFAGLPPEAADRAERATNTAAGLAASLRLAGTGTQEPLWERLGELAMPVLVVAGADDERFVALAERLADGIGANATLAVVAGAGHTVHRERPADFLALLDRWLP